jgi:hypothetical protein
MFVPSYDISNNFNVSDIRSSRGKVTPLLNEVSHHENELMYNRGTRWRRVISFTSGVRNSARSPLFCFVARQDLRPIQALNVLGLLGLFPVGKEAWASS